MESNTQAHASTYMKAFFVFVVLLCAVPLCVKADTVPQTQGVYSCNQNGANAMSVGTMSAIGGVYVPVNDAAVTLNTGYLVYLQCVLANVINRQKESIAEANTAIDVKFTTTGRNGSPMYVVKLSPERKTVKDKSMLNTLTNAVGSVDQRFAQDVKRQVARNYLAGDDFSCPYSADDESDPWVGLQSLGDAHCNPIFVANAVDQVATGRSISIANDFMTQIGWGNGFYPVSDVNDDGSFTVKTPGYIVSQNIVNALNVGRQMNSQLNGVIGSTVASSLFQAIMTYSVADSGGLTGLAQNSGGGGSYIDRMSNQTQGNLFNSNLNAAAQALNAAYSGESSYNQILKKISDLVAGIITQIQGQETTCWDLITKAVCGDGNKPDANGVCTASDGSKYKVVTSTNHSQQVIDANNLTSIAASTKTSLAASDSLIAVFKQIADKMNSSNTGDQQAGLSQWNSLAQTGKLHTQNDVNNANQTLTSYQTSFGSLVSDNATNWGENTGWCNVKNTAVVDAWKAAWKQ